MVNTRSIEALVSEVQERASLFQKKCESVGIDILIICTFRDKESQDALYAQGRTIPGHIVTNAKGGDSFHQYHVAFDAVPVVNGKPQWQVFDKDGKMLETWSTVAKIAEEVGLEWAGNWHSFKEYDHFQYTAGLTLADFKNGKEIQNA